MSENKIQVKKITQKIFNNVIHIKDIEDALQQCHTQYRNTRSFSLEKTNNKILKQINQYRHNMNLPIDVHGFQTNI